MRLFNNGSKILAMATSGLLLLLGVLLYIMGSRLDDLRFSILGIIFTVMALLVGVARPLFLRYLSKPKVNLDLVYTLLHMRIVASGKPPATKLLASVSSEDLYSHYSKTLARAYQLAKDWGYNVSEALTYIAKGIGEKAFREVIQRFATTIRLGADTEKFLETEFDTLYHEYEYQYQRTLNNMRVLLGVYVATMAAVIFAMSSLTLLGFFFGLSTTLIFEAYIAAVLVPVGIGVLIILILPRDHFDVRGRLARINKTVKMIDILAIMGIMVSMATITFFIKRGGILETSNFSAVLVISGISFLPAGLLALVYEFNVQDIDTFFPVFMRSLGSFISTIPSLKHAIRQVLKADLGKLTKLIERFHVRLENEIPPWIAWRQFAIESGSELVRRGSKMFQDAIDYGGDPILAGNLVSEFNNSLLRLRRLRTQVSSNFTSTNIVIHATVVAISIFILGLVGYFNNVISQFVYNQTVISTQYIILTPVNIDFVSKIVYLFILVITMINAYLVSIVRPYSQKAYWFYLGVTLIATGVSAYLSSFAIKYILEAMPTFTIQT